VELLIWWVEEAAGISAKEIEQHFMRLAMPVVAAAGEK
jgi:hypothetical protein